VHHRQNGHVGRLWILDEDALELPAGYLTRDDYDIVRRMEVGIIKPPARRLSERLTSSSHLQPRLLG
jgi:hypothetical protein